MRLLAKHFGYLVGKCIKAAVVLPLDLMAKLIDDTFSGRKSGQTSYSVCVCCA